MFTRIASRFSLRAGTELARMITSPPQWSAARWMLLVTAITWSVMLQAGDLDQWLAEQARMVLYQKMHEAEKAQNAYAAIRDEAKIKASLAEEARKISAQKSQQAEDAQRAYGAIIKNAKLHDTNANRQAILDWLRRYGNPPPVEAH